MGSQSSTNSDGKLSNNSTAIRAFIQTSNAYSTLLTGLSAPRFRSQTGSAGWLTGVCRITPQLFLCQLPAWPPHPSPSPHAAHPPTFDKDQYWWRIQPATRAGVVWKTGGPGRWSGSRKSFKGNIWYREWTIGPALWLPELEASEYVRRIAECHLSECHVSDCHVSECHIPACHMSKCHLIIITCRYVTYQNVTFRNVTNWYVTWNNFTCQNVTYQNVTYRNVLCKNVTFQNRTCLNNLKKLQSHKTVGHETKMKQIIYLITLYITDGASGPRGTNSWGWGSFWGNWKMPERYINWVNPEATMCLG